jgi:hypothetical protein
MVTFAMNAGFDGPRLRAVLSGYPYTGYNPLRQVSTLPHRKPKRGDWPPFCWPAVAILWSSGATPYFFGFYTQIKYIFI